MKKNADILNSGSSGFSVGERIEVKSAVVEIDGGFEVLEVAVAMSDALDLFDATVEGFGLGVGDAEAEVVEQLVQVPMQLLGSLHDRNQSGVGGPEVPALPEADGAGLGLQIPEVAE